jgi:hypothetical protein
VLSRRFPSDPVHGFAVETEWALHLVQQGVALRSAEPLYLKRQFDRTAQDSVSIGWRFGMPRETLITALEHNRDSLLGSVGSDEPDGVPRDVVLLAGEAAMLRRWQVLPGAPLPFTEVQLHRARRVLAATEDDAFPDAARVAAMVHVALSRHHAALGDRRSSREEADLAVRRAPSDREACLWFAQRLLGDGALDDALTFLLRTAEVAPLDDGVTRQLGAVTRAITERYAAVEPSPASDAGIDAEVARSG